MTLLQPRRRRGFSLPEILVVMAIIAVLLGITIPAILKVREAGNQAVCQNNLRQLGLAVHQYHDEFNKMPPYVSTLHGHGIGSWFYFLMPFVGESQPELAKIHGSLMGGTTVYPVLTCPSDPSAVREPWLSKTNYVANWYAFTNTAHGCFAAPQAFSSLTNGLSNVVLFGECYSVCGQISRPSLESPYYHNFGVTGEDYPSDDPRYLPNDYTMFQVQPSVAPSPTGCDQWRIQTPHAALPVCLADGSVRTVTAGVDPLTWKKALKPRTGDLPGDW